MPNATIESFAKQSGKSVKEVEELWDKAKKMTDKLDYIEKESDQYYAYVTGTLKRMLNIDES